MKPRLRVIHTTTLDRARLPKYELNVKGIFDAVLLPLESRMPRIEFTPQLLRHVECGGLSVDAPSLRPALEAAFSTYPKLRGYIVDDQNDIRQHVAIFVDNQLLRDRHAWDIPLQPESEVYVMQALSGG